MQRHRHRQQSSLVRHVRFITTGVVAVAIAGSLASAPFIAHASTQQSSAQRTTDALSQQGSLDREHLSVYAEQAEYRAHAEAAQTIDSANTVIAAASSKVDATQLSTTVKQLANYKLLSVGRVEALTDATQTAAQQTQSAIAAADAAAAAAAEAARVANTPDGARAQARDIMASSYGWGEDQFSCLNSLWTKESNWRVEASNGGSGATGIPQALPGDKMATVAADWQTSARTQIIWGLGYIKGSYGTPCAAWSHSQSLNWY